ncbi:MAG: mannosyl-3-phosphoglycerate phosphatase, partial [Nitrospirota bacterium]
HYRKKLDNLDPFISENGGGIYVPKDYFKFSLEDTGLRTEDKEGYKAIILGTEYEDLRKALLQLRQEGIDLKGFGDMTIKEVAAVTGLSHEEAGMAKDRDYDEPVLFKGSAAETERLIQRVHEMGLNYTYGQFFHILGNSDKGRAVSILTDLYRKRYGNIVTIAVGDSPNDLPMLGCVDYPVIVRKRDGTYDGRISVPGLVMAEGIGPSGWDRAVRRLIDHLA